MKVHEREIIQNEKNSIRDGDIQTNGENVK